MARLLAPPAGDSGTRAAVLADDEAADGPGGLRGLLPALLLLAVGLVTLTLATALSDGVEGQFVVIAPPLGGQNAAVSLVVAAGGAMVTTGGFANVVIAASDRPGFDEDLRRAGAWAVFPAPRFLGCATEDLKTATAIEIGAPQ